MKIIDLVVSPEVKNLVAACKEYVTYVAKIPTKDVNTFWEFQLPLLARIYSDIYRVPRIDLRYSGDIEKFVTETDYNKVHKALKKLFGQLDMFPDFNDLSHPGALKVVEVSLSELFADIYQELKDFVKLYEKGSIEEMNDALLEFLNTFEHVWGMKIPTILKIGHVHLHQYRYATANKTTQLEVNINDMIDDNAAYGLSED